MRRGFIGGEGVKYNKCKRLAVLQRGEFILGSGARRCCGLLVTKLFAASGLRYIEDCHDILRYQILRYHTSRVTKPWELASW